MTTYEAFKINLPAKTKATLLIENEWGFVVARHVWLISYGAQRKDARRYELSLQAKFIYKGKQSTTAIWLNNATIAEGWQNVDGVISNNKGGEWTCFDQTSFDAAEAQLSNIISSTKQLKELDKARILNMVQA